MVEHTISDVLHGIVRFRRDKITTGDFLLKKTITVADGDLINIVEEYTSAGNAPTSETVFHGRIDDVDYAKTQYVHAIDISEELDQIRPSGNYSGYTDIVLGGIINDSSLTNVTCEQTNSSILLVPISPDISTGDWLSPPLYSKIDEGETPNDTDFIRANPLNTVCELNIEDNSLSSSYNYIIYKIDVITRAKSLNDGDHTMIQMSLRKGGSWTSYQNIHTTWLWSAYSDFPITFDDLYLTQDDINDFRLRYKKTSGERGYISNAYLKVYYRYYPNLAKATVKANYNLGGNMSIKNVLKTLNLIELKTWYIPPDFEIHFDGGDTASGKTINATDKLNAVIGWRQIKSYDKVVLYGAYVGGSQIVSTRGSGNIIWRDNYLHIDDQVKLDALADQILVEQGANTIRVQLKRTYPTDGIYQVGETIEIGAGVKFSGSDRTIPIAEDATYIVNKIDYIITDGTYNYLDIELLDGLLFSTPKDDSLGIIEDGTLENSLGINQVAGGESVGQSNTGSNIGTDGYGVFESKAGVTLQFRNVAPASSKVTVALNSYDIDIGVDESNFDESNFSHNSLGGLNDGDNYEHLTATQVAALHAEAHVLATTGPHTGKLPLNNLDGGTVGGGSIIRVGSVDWEKLAKGTEGYFLKAGATDISWAQLVETDISNLDHDDTDAIHVDAANEITGITPKTSLVNADELVLEDSAASFIKKAVTFGNIESSISLANLGTRTHANLSDAPTDAHHNEDHDNTHHTTNYHTEADGTGVVTVHNDITSAGSGIIITAGERTGLHTRSHTMNSTSDHQSTVAWTLFYANGTNDIIEIPIGADTKVLKSNGPTTAPTWQDDNTGGAGGDTDAIHDNVANEITVITLKTTPADADELIIEDSAASYIKKSITVGSLPKPELQLPTWATSGTSMSISGNWVDVDISATYGAKKHLVFLYIVTVDNGTGINLSIRPKGSADSTTHLTHQVANINSTNFATVQTDSSGIWQYICNFGLSSASYRILGVLTP